MRLLVSVRSVDEARLAAAAGVDFIDLKEPRDGALGGLPVATIAAIVQALRHGAGAPPPISATIGDLPTSGPAVIVARVAAVAACGVDYVKVGIERDAAAAGLLHALAASGHAVVPVFIADRGLAFDDVAVAAGLGFPALMVDTADKRAGSLFEALPLVDLQRFVATVRGSSAALVGLAGALRLPQLDALKALRPDFAGFRSAVCDGDRGGALDAQRLRALVEATRTAAAARHPEPR